LLPLTDWPIAQRRDIVGVFTDIDDTLTTDGAITPDALQALADLKTAGLHVIPITGRPVGWSQPFARGDAALGIAPWPVDAIVAENGSVALLGDKIGAMPAWNMDSSLSKLYHQDAPTRLDNFERMQRVVRQILSEVPGALLSQEPFPSLAECPLANVVLVRLGQHADAHVAVRVDRKLEAQNVFGTSEDAHPGAKNVTSMPPYCLAGRVTLVEVSGLSCGLPMTPDVGLMLWPTSAGPGAWNPLEYVPRNETCLSGVNLTPILGASEVP